MGKVARVRKNRLHAKAAPLTREPLAADDDASAAAAPAAASAGAPLAFSFVAEPTKEVPAVLAPVLAEAPAQRKEPQLTKKDKRLERRQHFLEKLGGFAMAEARRLRDVGAREEQQTSADASGSGASAAVERLVKAAEAAARPSPAHFTGGKRQHLVASEQKVFQGWIQAPEFQKDPFAALTAHLAKKGEQKAMAEKAELKKQRQAIKAAKKK
eukprot:m51a1_g13760 hypothetical protein (213) ;mRNA; f:233097-234211